MKKRKSPKAHRVKTQHPRYDVSDYNRGKGQGKQVVRPQGAVDRDNYWRDHHERVISSDKFREPDNLRWIPEDEWRRLVMINNVSPEENVLLYIDPTTTATPYFDGMLADKGYYINAKGKSFDIVWMSPDGYFSAIAKNRDKPMTNSMERKAVNDETARKYADMMKSGILFPMPNIDEYGSQEGRHRARALEMLGVRRMPVMIIRDKINPNEMPPPERDDEWKITDEFRAWKLRINKK